MFEEYFNAAPVGLLIYNSEGEYLDTNPATCRMLGYTREELLSLTIKNLLVPGAEEAHRISFARLKAAGSASGERSMRRKDGTRIEVMTHSIAISEGRFLAFCSDLSPQRTAERRGGLYHDAMESLEQAVIIADLSGAIIEVNRAFCELYGYSTQEVLGKNPRILNPSRSAYIDLGYTGEEYDQLFRGLWESIRDPLRGSWKGTVVNRRKDGNLVWASLQIDTIHDEAGQALGYVGLPFDISESKRKEKLSKVELYSTIAALADLRDNETGGHMKRVGLFTKLLAKAQGMPRQYCDDIEFFAPMHDIGKVGILDSILLAPRKLSPEEFEEMKVHTVLGHNIVKGKKELEMVSAITLRHHERWDGSGYPGGLAGEDIPLSARITAVADIYDALRSARPYKRAWSHEEAVAEIRAISGRHLDPGLVDFFLGLASTFEMVYARIK